MSIKEMKAEITALGYEKEMAGLLEKSEFVALLERARRDPKVRVAPAAATPKVNVLLLSEVHEDMKCMLDNSKKMMDVLKKHTYKQNFLCVSEGRSINPCYQGMQIPPDRIIQENGETQTDIEMLDKFLLNMEFIFAVVDGELADGYVFPQNGVVMSKKYFKDRYSYDGWEPLFRKIGINYLDMVDAAFRRDRSTVNGMMAVILTKIIPLFPDINGGAVLANGSFVRYSSFKPILDQMRESRDRDIIRRLEERVRQERREIPQGNLQDVVIIFGALHHPHLSQLIRQSDVLKLDPTSKGGYRKTKRNTKPKKIKKSRRYK